MQNRMISSNEANVDVANFIAIKVVNVYIIRVDKAEWLICIMLTSPT